MSIDFIIPALQGASLWPRHVARIDWDGTGSASINWHHRSASAITIRAVAKIMKTISPNAN